MFTQLALPTLVAVIIIIIIVIVIDSAFRPSRVIPLSLFAKLPISHSFLLNMQLCSYFSGDILSEKETESEIKIEIERSRSPCNYSTNTNRGSINISNNFIKNKATGPKILDKKKLKRFVRIVDARLK